MQTSTLAAALALALLLPACVSAAARAAGGGSGGAVTVLVRNGTTDALRVTARGTRGARLQPGQSACLVFNDAAQPVSLNAVAVGTAGRRATSSPDGSVQVERRPGSTTVGSEGVMVSPSFVPMAAAAWRWELGVQSGRRVVDAVPVETPCT